MEQTMNEQTDHEENELLPLFFRIGELLHRRRHMSHHRHGAGGDPHRGQGRVMSLLKMRPEISQKELSYLLDIRPQSLGELLAKLERAGFIERESSSEDRRVMNIRLTESGAAAPDPRPEEDAGLFSSLGEDDRTRLAGYLRKIIADLEKTVGSLRGGEDAHGHHGHGEDVEGERKRHRHGRGMGRHAHGGEMDCSSCRKGGHH